MTLQALLLLIVALNSPPVGGQPDPARGGRDQGVQNSMLPELARSGVFGHVPAALNFEPLGPVPARDTSQEAVRTDSAPPAAQSDVNFYDRLHQTFLKLNDVVIPAYVDHFRDEPEKLAVVRYYADRLGEVHKRSALSVREPAEIQPSSAGGALDESAPPDVWMRSALAQAHGSNADVLAYQLGVLGSRAHAVLQRADESGDEARTARCPLFDAELLWAHRRLWELKTGRPAPAAPQNLRDAIAARHAAIVGTRQLPEKAELSLRRFLDQERQTVWELAWLYRCLGVEQERADDERAARQSYLRAWAIGDALFPAAERGRLERFDPLFLAELGDVYARLGRFDLMLRYMYSENGLPARYEMARPVAELARVAESVRLARPGERPSEDLAETFPETVSQILFEQAVAPDAGGRVVASTEPPSRLGAYVVTGIGLTLLLGAAAVAVARRSVGTPSPQPAPPQTGAREQSVRGPRDESISTR
jgi:hypothetical protein